MAVTDAYASAAAYRKLISKTDSADDAEIDTDLRAVSRYLDRMLGRFFTKDAEAAARIFAREPQGHPRVLWVDDLAVVPTSVKIDENGDGGFAGETSLAAADFELWPLNAGKGPEPRPWTMIHLPRFGRQNRMAGRPPGGSHRPVGLAGHTRRHRQGHRAPDGGPAAGNAQGHQTGARAGRRVRGEL